MSALDANNLLQGFQSGYNFGSAIDDKNHRRKMEQSALEKNDARYQEQIEYRNQRDRVGDMRYQSALNMQEQARAEDVAHRNKVFQSDDRHKKSIESRQAREASRAEYGPLLLTALKLTAETGQQFPPELMEAAGKYNMKHLTPEFYLDPEKVAAAKSLEQALKQAGETKDLSAANTPAVLEPFNKVYADQIKIGVGETDPRRGAKIVDKELVGFRARKGGKVISIVRTTLDNGESYDAELTLNRSSDPDDPVQLTDFKKMASDIRGRAGMAALLSSPEAQERLQMGLSWMAPAGGKSGSSLPANAQNVEYLVANGMTRDQATKLVFESKGKSPQEQAAIFAKAEFEAQDQYAEDRKPLEHFYSKWNGLLSAPGAAQAGAMQPGPQVGARQAAPQAALDALAKNPALADQFRAKYGYLPDAKQAAATQPAAPTPSAPGSTQTKGNDRPAGYQPNNPLGATRGERAINAISPPEFRQAISDGVTAIGDSVRETTRYNNAKSDYATKYMKVADQDSQEWKDFLAERYPDLFASRYGKNTSALAQR